MIDLMSIARTESDSGDLFGTLSNLFTPSDIKPEGYPDAVVWEGGHHNGKVNPVAHSLTDAYALLGTIAATDILGLPFYAVPMWEQEYVYSTISDRSKLGHQETCRFLQLGAQY